jgi:VRR-NUC domain
VIHNSRTLPAELAVLGIERSAKEEGVWLNSRGTKTGVVDLLRSTEHGVSKYRTKRTELPDFIVSLLERIYGDTKLQKGCPDLVIWNPDTKAIRFVEVKCPHWDSLSPEQDEFMNFCSGVGASTKIVEWEFKN